MIVKAEKNGLPCSFWWVKLSIFFCTTGSANGRDRYRSREPDDCLKT